MVFTWVLAAKIMTVVATSMLPAAPYIDKKLEELL